MKKHVDTSRTIPTIGRKLEIECCVRLCRSSTIAGASHRYKIMASVLGRPSYHFSSKVILRALAALTAVSVFVNLLRSYTFTSSVTTKEATTATVNYANAKATAQSPGVQVMPSATTAHCVNHANKDSFS